VCETSLEPKLSPRIHSLASLAPSLQLALKSEIEDSLRIAKAEAWVGSWNEAAIQSELKLGTAFVAIGEADQGLRGFLLFRPPGPFWEITLVETLPSFRAQGVATRLIEALFQHAALKASKDSAPQRQGAVTQPEVELGLEVRADNVAALQCYKLCGFIEQGRRKAYYPDGVDAVLMSATRS